MYRSENKFKIAQVGMGRWGKIIFQSARKIKEIDVEYVVSSNPETRKVVDDNVTVVKEWVDLKKHIDDISGVIVTSIPHVHRELLEYFVSIGKPVFVEKPVVLELSDLDCLDKVVGPTYYFVNYIHLHSFHYQAIKKYIEDNKLEIIGIKSEGYNNGPVRTYSPLWDYGPHDLAFAFDLFGEKYRLTDASFEKYDDKNAFMCKANIEFQYENKARFSSFYFGNREKHKKRNLSIYCRDRVISLDDTIADKIKVEQNGSQSKFNLIDPKDYELQLTPVQRSLKEFYKFASEGSKEKKWHQMTRHLTSALDQIEKSANSLN